MKITRTEIDDVLVLEPKVFGDRRGYFMETWRRDAFNEAVGRDVDFVQDNESSSSRGVLRGLHYQRGGFSQAKLVRVISGRVVDIAVDLRLGSPTFGRHVAVELTGENRRQLFIPRGFAHGFIVMSDSAVFAYKVDNAYRPDMEVTLRFDDPEVAVAWPDPQCDLVLSPKDLQGRSLGELRSAGLLF